MCSFLLGKYYLELEQLDCMVNVCLIFWDTTIVFQNDCTIWHSSQEYVRVPVAPDPCEHLVLPGFFFSNCSKMYITHHLNEF